MKDSSEELLLAEYDRLKTLQQNRLETSEHSVQFYLTVITAGTGAFLFLLGNYPTASASQPIIIILLGAILLLGVVTYSRLVGLDIELLEISKRFRLIRDGFFKEDSELTVAFPQAFPESAERFRSWSSIGGIIGRAISASAYKTTVTLLNCVIAVAVVIIVVRPSTFDYGLVIGTSAALLVGFPHAVYASWRYKSASKQLGKGVVSWWM
jgi:hypothetical protein